MRVLVTGALGMLGQDVMRALERAGHEPLPRSHAELDLAGTHALALARELEALAPDGVVNCAAWTDVDGAESRPDEAHAINAAGAGALAAAAASVAAPLIHVSTDYVFDGIAPCDARGIPRPYVESDRTAPISVYGRTKLEGEELVLAASRSHAVVRSAWLFGTGGGNFAATMLRLASESQEAEPRVRVVTDQLGCPTWTGHLAPALVGLLERGISGLAHLAGGGVVSWNGFAREIFRQAEIACVVEEITSEQVQRPAPRPAWSALASERDDVLPLPPWQDGLAGFLAARAGMMRR